MFDTMRSVLVVLLLLSIGGCASSGGNGDPAASLAAALEGRLVDLTHAYGADTVYWPTATVFDLREMAYGTTPSGYFYASYDFTASEHGGTHMDAPIHFYEGMSTVDRVPLRRLIAPGVVVDVSQKCIADPDYLVGVQDLTDWEAEHGTIPEGAIVLVRTGFGRFWPDRTRYLGTDERGPDAIAKLHFPGMSAEAVTWLATERALGAVGLDTASLDHGQSKDFAAHVALFKHDVPALENVANLHELPPTGFTVIALPMKIAGGSGGPTRIVAVVP
jgi:kynurenine formamidase